MELNGERCTAAHMHDNMFYPGLGEVKKEIVVGGNGINQVKSINIDGLFVIIKILGSTAKKVYTLVVPTTNFKFLVLEETVVTTQPLKE